MYNEVTVDVRVNPMSYVWDGNLWQRAISSEKKQTFHSINGLIGRMNRLHTDLIFGAGEHMAPLWIWDRDIFFIYFF